MTSSFIHVVTNGKVYFLWLNNIPVCVCVCVCVCDNFFIHSSIDGLGYFHAFAIIEWCNEYGHAMNMDIFLN